MDPTTVAKAVPMTAWEQAAVVVLFVLFVIVVFGIIKFLLSWTGKQQTSWQGFIEKRDTQWQSWMKETNCQTTNSLEHIAKSLEKLSQKIDAHDEKVDVRISGAVDALRGRAVKK